MVWTRNKAAGAAGTTPSTPAPAVDHGAPPPPLAATPPPAQPAAAAPPPTFADQSAPAAPPAQPAAPPVTRRRRAGAAVETVPAQPAAAAAAPPPAQPAAAAQPAKPATATTAVTTAPAVNLAALYAPGGALSVFGAPKVNGLAAIVSQAQARGEPNLFPTVYVTSGATGGLFDTDAMNPEGSDADLPTGRKPIDCILFGYRLFVTNWPHAASDQGNGEAPKWKGNIGHLDGELFALAMAAMKKYQMSKGAGKERLGQVFDAYGHPQLALELLVCEAGAGLMVIRSCATYQSVIETANQLMSLYCGEGKDGSIYAEAVRVENYTEQVKSKGREWLEHWPTLKVIDRSSPAAQAAGATFASLMASPETQEIQADIFKWASTSLLDEHLDQLEAISQQDTRS
jgi:hypothetical protein